MKTTIVFRDGRREAYAGTPQFSTDAALLSTGRQLLNMADVQRVVVQARDSGDEAINVFDIKQLQTFIERFGDKEHVETLRRLRREATL